MVGLTCNKPWLIDILKMQLRILNQSLWPASYLVHESMFSMVMSLQHEPDGLLDTSQDHGHSTDDLLINHTPAVSHSLSGLTNEDESDNENDVAKDNINLSGLLEVLEDHFETPKVPSERVCEFF